MKILHITPAYKPAFVYGGPTMSVAALCENLAGAGLQIEVFTTTANGAGELEVDRQSAVMVDGVKTSYFDRITKDHTHFSPALLKTLWQRAYQFDIIHIHSWWNLVAVMACMTALFKKKRVVISPRGMLSNYSFANKNVSGKNLIHQLFGKRLLNNSYLHVTSANEKKTVGQLISPLSITVLPNFVKLTTMGNPVPKRSGEILKLLFFSRIDEKKGLDILIYALKSVTVPYHLTIAGNGEPAYIAQLKNIAVAQNAQSHITWAGYHGDNKFELLRRHNLLVLPSHNENFGNVVIESLSVGTAVLISEDVGLADYIERHGFGWVCKADPAAVGTAITTIWQHHQQDLLRIAGTAPAVVTDDFTGNSLAQRYINMYRQILQNE